ASRSAGVRGVVDGDALDAELAEHHLARNGDLALQRTVGHAGIKRDAEVGGGAAGVFQRAGESFARQVVERTLEMSAEHGHGDAGDIDVAHGESSWLRMKPVGTGYIVRCAPSQYCLRRSFFNTFPTGLRG